MSIRYKVSALVCGLLVVGAAVASSLTYLELRRAALSSAQQRMTAVTDQLATLLVASADEVKAQTIGLASDVAVLEYLRAPNEETRRAVEIALDSVADDGGAPDLVEMRRPDGTSLLAMGDNSLTGETPTVMGLGSRLEQGDSAIVGPFEIRDEAVTYGAAAPILENGELLGYVVQRRRVGGPQNNSGQIRGLIGSASALYVGNTSGDVWTDLAGVAPAPPVDLSPAGDTLLEYDRDGAGRQLAAARRVPGLPWLVLLEFPRGPVIAGARDTAARLAAIMALLTIAGTVMAWLVSRSMLWPLADAADAAGAIAQGNLGRRIDSEGDDELGELAAAFNTMAERVEKAQARLEQKVKERTAELQAVNEELEAFSYSVSHDLRSPLRSIDGFCQALLEDAEDDLDETGRGHLQRVRAASQRMAQLIDDLLELSRVTRSEMRRQPVDLTVLAQEIATDLTHDQERREEVVVARNMKVSGDHRLLRVALENLIGNALKFTGHRSEPLIEIGAEDHGTPTVFYVRDNGAGFDMSYAEHLFTPFQRLHTDSEFEGSGIGLATVQRIIHRHGGRVWAEAEVDRGATIRFTLDDGADLAETGNA